MTTLVRHILGLFPMKPVRCSCCRLRIDGDHLWVHRSCVACGAVFRIHRRYFWTMYILALVVSFGLAFAVGNRDSALGSLAVLIVLPIFWGMVMINLRLFPADIEVVVNGWTPGDSDADRELEREFEALRELDPVLGWAKSEPPPPEPGIPADGAPGRRPLSTPKSPPITLEGIAIAIALSALLAYHVYVAAEPHIHFGTTSTESVVPPPPAQQGR